MVMRVKKRLLDRAQSTPLMDINPQEDKMNKNINVLLVRAIENVPPRIN